jgi:hypothetical protein
MYSPELEYYAFYPSLAFQQHPSPYHLATVPYGFPSSAHNYQPVASFQHERQRPRTYHQGSQRVAYPASTYATLPPPSASTGRRDNRVPSRSGHRRG